MPNIQTQILQGRKKNGRIWNKNILDPFAIDL